MLKPSDICKDTLIERQENLRNACPRCAQGWFNYVQKRCGGLNKHEFAEFIKSRGGPATDHIVKGFEDIPGWNDDLAVSEKRIAGALNAYFARRGVEITTDRKDDRICVGSVDGE
jgi:hypothetical protein